MTKYEAWLAYVAFHDRMKPFRLAALERARAKVQAAEESRGEEFCE